ncbi:MAG: stage III sporulation protein AB [Clostridia bacterium]
MQLACIVLVVSCTYIGYKLSQKYKIKEKLYYSFVSFCASYTANLEYKLDKLSALFSSPSYSSEFITIKDAYYSGKDISLKYLTQQEANYIKDFFNLLGKNDARTQIKEVEFFSKYFNKKYEEVSSESKSKALLVLKLGVFVGVLLCIIII